MCFAVGFLKCIINACVHHHCPFGLFSAPHPPPPSPSPPTSWTNCFRRVRELEEELRLMDQNLKSMMCGEEEVEMLSLLLCAPLACSLSASACVCSLTCTSSLSFFTQDLMCTGRFFHLFFNGSFHEDFMKRPQSALNWLNCLNIAHFTKIVYFYHF